MQIPERDLLKNHPELKEIDKIFTQQAGDVANNRVVGPTKAFHFQKLK
jgi:hypothetical protein